MLAENNIVTTINHSSNNTVYTLTDTVSNINLAIDNLVYVTPTHWNGNDTMYFLLNDTGNVGNGGALYDTASISIVVAAVDNPFTLDIPRKVAVEEGQQVLLPSFLLHDIDSFHSDFRVQIMVYCGYITMNRYSLTHSPTHSLTYSLTHLLALIICSFILVMELPTVRLITKEAIQVWFHPY